MIVVLAKFCFLNSRRFCALTVIFVAVYWDLHYIEVIMVESRLQKSILNAKVNLAFYFVILFLSFFSRKIFLDALGPDFVGLTGTLGNILSFLNLAEFGVASAVSVVLYKPLYQKDRLQINEVISVFGYLYRKIGWLIAGVGIILSFFLPLIFPHSGFSYPLIYFVYYSFLLSSLLSYFFNYKQTLLAADQKNYVVTICSQLTMIVKTIVQIGVLYYTRNGYYWVLIELIFGVLFAYVLHKRIFKVYPWLKAEPRRGKELAAKYPLVMKYTKQLFIHKMGYFIQYQTKPLLIYAFVSLQTVAFYGNYALIIDKVNMLINSVLGGTTASIGSLIAEGEQFKIQRIFWELSSLRFFLAGILVFALYQLVGPFISLWLGDTYLLSHSFLLILLANAFILIVRGTVDQFINGYGIFYDVWASGAEIAINLTVSLVGGYFWGLNGVLLGSVVSMLCIVCLWKPYLLYKRGFQISQSGYWMEVLKQLALLLLVSGVTLLVLSLIPLSPSQSYSHWLLAACVITGLFSSLAFVAFYTAARGFRGFVNRILLKLKEKIVA